MYVHEHLNIAMVVILQFLFHYEIIYMKWVHQCPKSRLRSPSPIPRPSLHLGEGMGVTRVMFLQHLRSGRL